MKSNSELIEDLKTNLCNWSTLSTKCQDLVRKVQKDTRCDIVSSIIKLTANGQWRAHRVEQFTGRNIYRVHSSYEYEPDTKFDTFKVILSANRTHYIVSDSAGANIYTLGEIRNHPAFAGIRYEEDPDTWYMGTYVCDKDSILTEASHKTYTNISPATPIEVRLFAPKRK